MGVPQDPKRAGRPGSQGRGVDRMGDPQGERHRPRPATGRADVVTIPALPGRRDPGERLLHGRPARRHPGIRTGRDRTRQQAHPHPRGHPVPLENRIRLVTCGSSGWQAACMYSLIRPPRTECPPGGVQIAGSRPVVAARDPPHGRLADVVAETSQFAVHPAVAPGRVLPREPQHQGPDLPAGRRPSWPVGICP